MSAEEKQMEEQDDYHIEEKCENKNWLTHENTYLLLTVIAFALSELLPFVEEFCGVKIEGNGLLHIIKALLTKDYAGVQEGIVDMLEETEQSQ